MVELMEQKKVAESLQAEEDLRAIEWMRELGIHVGPTEGGWYASAERPGPDVVGVKAETLFDAVRGLVRYALHGEVAEQAKPAEGVRVEIRPLNMDTSGDPDTLWRALRAELELRPPTN